MKKIIFIMMLLILSINANASNLNIETIGFQWQFYKQINESDYNSDGIPDIISTFNQVNDLIIEIIVNDTRETGGYKWASAICNISNLDYVDKLEYNPATETWTDTGILQYDYLQYYGLPSDWCEDQGGYGYVLFGSGSGDKIYRLVMPPGRKEFDIIAGKGSEQTKIVYQNQSKMVFIEDELMVNNTLRKWNGEEFVIAPEDIWINEPSGDNYKFGANDSVAVKDTFYQYEWISNKEIRFDGYYYFDEEYSTDNGINKFYNRRVLDVEDVCDDRILNNATVYPNCTFMLINEYDNVTDNETEGGASVLSYSKLLMNFTGFYDNISDMVFIDPEYSFDNVSIDATLSYNIKSEDPFSHLNSSNSSLALDMNFDREPTSDLLVYDYSNSNNDGKANATTWNSTGGITGGVFDFDGDDYITTGYNFDGKTYFTMSGWFKRKALNSYVYIADSGGTTTGQVQIGFFNDGKLYVGVDGTYQSVASNDVNWHHVVFTYNSTESPTTVLYLDGVNQSVGTIASGAVGTNNVRLIVGLRNTSTPLYSDGWIDNVKVFDTVLTKEEAVALYHGEMEIYYKQGNQTFTMQNVTLTNDNSVNITVKGQALNDSSLKARVYQSADNNLTFKYNIDMDSLLLYYHCENASTGGNDTDNYVYDYSGHNNIGISSMNYAVLKDYDFPYDFGSGCRLNGLNNYIGAESADMLDNNNISTESAWVYLTGQGESTYPRLADKGNSVDQKRKGLYFDFTGGAYRICAYIDRTVTDQYDCSANNVFTTNTWYHIVWVFDNTYSSDMNRIWLNGKKIDGVAYQLGSGDPTDDSANSIIIGDWPGSGRAFQGIIDEFMYFNRTLSVSEIQELYRTGSIDHRNGGAGLNWSLYSEDGMTAVNSTHLTSTHTIDNNSVLLLTELEYDSANGFYSPYVENIDVKTYYEAGEPAEEDTTPSAINLTAPDNNSYWDYNTSPNFDYTVNETCNSVLYINNSDNASGSAVKGNNTISSNTGNGFFQWNITCNDTSNNIGVSEFRYLTVNYSAPADSCSCPSGSDWLIDDGSICYVALGEYCDIRPNKLYVNNGRLRVYGTFYSDGCFSKDTNGIYLDANSNSYCG